MLLSNDYDILKDFKKMLGTFDISTFKIIIRFEK